MAEVHGSDTVILVKLASAGGAAEDISAVCKSSEIQRKGGTQDLSTYGNRNEIHKGQMKTGTFNLSGKYFSGATTNPRATFESHVTEDFIFTRRMEGTGTTKPQQLFTAVLTGYNDPAPVADWHVWSATFQISGAVDYTAQA